VFIIGVWRGSADATTDEVLVPTGSLLSGGRIRALQCLCALISGLSEPEVNITYGQMKFAQVPFPIVTGPFPQTVTVMAHDIDDNHLVDAQIYTSPNKALLAKTNHPFTRLFPYFYNPNNETFTVEAPGYLVQLFNFSTVDPKPVANFSFAPKQPYANQDVFFFDFSSGPISSYEWAFGLGKATSSSKNPVFKYWSFGQYKATLTVKGPGGQDARTQTVYVSPAPYNPPQTGFDELEFYFCPAAINTPKMGDHSTLYIYTADLTAKSGFGPPVTLQHGYVGGGMNYAGVCGPGQGSGSEKVTLKDKHQYLIVGVDPDLCGSNDPNNGACVAWQGTVWGKQGGGTLIVTVS
jgi:PKD repeat protein